MKKGLLILLAVCAATVWAGAKKDEALKKISEHIANKGKTPWTWVFYGDSITHGAAHTWGWRSFMEIFHERIRGEYLIKRDMVINAGSSGYTALELLSDSYYNWTIKRFQPDVVFLLIGSNDITTARCGGLEGFRKNLDNLIVRLQNDGAIVVLQTYPLIEKIEKPTKPHHHGYIKRYNEFPAYNQAIREIAAKHDLILIDHEAHWIKHASDPDVLLFWLGESIHPGARGHLEMANCILKGLNLYSPRSRCSSVEAGGKMPVKQTEQAVLKSDFNDFEIAETPAKKTVPGGLWYRMNNARGAYTVVNEGVNGSPCLRVMRDGDAGMGAFRIEKAMPAESNRKVSFKLKVAKGHGVALNFLKKGVAVTGGALFIGGTPVRGYNEKSAWQASGIASVFPSDEWVTCEIDFNSADKNYTISIISADGKKMSGTVKHPFIKDLQVDEVRFLNIMPQKSFSLIDDFEFSLK